MNHRLVVQWLLLGWLLCVARLAFAETFLNEVRGFDYESLLTATLAGLLGGILRTIFTLASDNRVVFSVLKESRGDLVVSFMAGGACYLGLIVIESKFPGVVTREIRFVGVLAAGWLGRQFWSAASRLARAKMDGKAAEFRAGAASTDPVISAIVPLTETKP